MNKKFDCVEMKHSAAVALNKKLSKMTREEELEYWNKLSKKMKEEQKKLKTKIKFSSRHNAKAK